jgi:hypothetical protein
MLKKFFDIHVRWLNEIAAECPPGDDIAPILSYSDANLCWTYEQLSEALTPDRVTQILKERNAAYYALVFPSWTFDASYLNVIQQHGPDHPDVLPYRREGYTVIAGSKEGTITAAFLVDRAPDGRITGLRRQPFPLAASGSLVDLLRR